MVDKRRPGPKQEVGPPLIPRTAKGRCGTCGGGLIFDDDFKADKCQSCGRLAGPAPPPPEPVPPTPEEVRASVLSELTGLAGDMLTDSEFWQKYCLADDVAAICGANKKAFRDWLSYQKYPFERRRSPISGKWSHFLLIDTAKAVIQHRVGISRP